MTRRTDRIEDLVRATLAEILLRDVSDPRARRATVSAVDVTADLSHARVRVSVLGEEADRLATVEALQHAVGFMRGRLAARLRHLKRIPELHFQLDRGFEHAQHISDLLENLDEHEPAT